METSEKAPHEIDMTHPLSGADLQAVAKLAWGTALAFARAIGNSSWPSWEQIDPSIRPTYASYVMQVHRELVDPSYCWTAHASEGEWGAFMNRLWLSTVRNLLPMWFSMQGYYVGFSTAGEGPTTPPAAAAGS